MLLLENAIRIEKNNTMMTIIIKQQRTSGDLSSAFQFTNTIANYTIIRLLYYLTSVAIKPKIDVEAPTETDVGWQSALNKFPPILLSILGCNNSYPLTK